MSNNRNRNLCVFTLLLLLFCYGCAQLPARPAPRLPAGTTLRSLPALDREAAVAWHPSGNSLAAGKDGLIRYELESNQVMPFGRPTPERICWSANGEQLLAVYSEEGNSRLVLFSFAGEQLAELPLAGRVEALFWPADAPPLVLASQLRHYSFGSDFTLELVRWDGRAAAQRTPLHHATLKQSTARALEQGIVAASRAALSPQQDELVYLQLRDPPVITTGYRLQLRHLDTGAERSIAPLPLDVSALYFLDDAHVVVDGGGAGNQDLALWTDPPATTRLQPGIIRALSPNGLDRLIDDRLWHNGSEIGQFPDVLRGSFSPDGTQLLLQDAGGWQLLTGLDAAASTTLSPDARNRLRQLRAWRSRGLITPQDYNTQRMDILSP